MVAELRVIGSFKTLCFIEMLLATTYFLARGIPVQAESVDIGFQYDPPVRRPTYPATQGPWIYLDEGHYNRHLYGGLGGFDAFKDVLSADGYNVKSFASRFTDSSLDEVRILVISLPQDERNLGPPWHNPTHSAFKQSEIDALKRWVEKGGSLFLIVDHQPFAGASNGLAQAFGFTLFNGHAEDTGSVRRDIFSREDGTLEDNVITRGRNSDEAIDTVKTFGGAAIALPEAAIDVLRFDDDWVQYLPDTAWNFSDVEPESIDGLSQGGYSTHGEGKVVVFGDGNMFSAQIDEDGEIAGFIDPEAPQNHQLLLNVMHYLDGLLD